MDIEKELAESWKKIGKIQKKLMRKSEDVGEQISILEKEIDKLVSELNKRQDKSKRLELLTRLCLLSELCSAIDFDRMIEAREKFQDLLPQHFKEYLAHLKTIPWHISWSGCLKCRHFSGKCNLNLMPLEVSDSKHGLQKTCPSWVKKSGKL
ncbi:MAG: hypothetical protein QME54_03010 [Actinomycetota bacterium]|nr:hypothetical protein [Actinomycetota bacterium]